MDNNEKLQSVNDLVDIAGRLKSSTVLIAGGHRIEDLRLVESARDHGIVDRMILVGNKKLIKKSVSKLEIKVSEKESESCPTASIASSMALRAL